MILLLQSIDCVDHLADLIQICGEQRLRLDLLRLTAFFALIEESIKRRGIDAEVFSSPDR